MPETVKSILDTIGNSRVMALLEGATSADILLFEIKNNIALPKKYKEWLLFSDGGELFLPAGIQLYGVTHKPLIDVDDNDRPSNDYIVIGALSNGDPIIFKKEKEEISIYNHEAGIIEEDETYKDFFLFLKDLPNLLGVGG